ncbi:MAG: DUF169 domain-containing protein [Promethearchaeota archaeon]
MVRLNSLIKILEGYLNVRVVGVTFDFQGTLQGEEIEPMRYCEAVNKVMQNSSTVLLRARSISCPAARKILGFIQDGQQQMQVPIKELVEEGRFKDETTAYAALNACPRLDQSPKAVLLSREYSDADVYVFHITPLEFMKLMQAYQYLYGQEAHVDISSVMPVCGNCSVRPFVTKTMGISFGCNDSRQYGGITNDKFVVGLPARYMREICEALLMKVFSFIHND